MDFNINFREKNRWRFTQILRRAQKETFYQHLTNKDLYGKIQRLKTLSREQLLRFAGKLNGLTSEFLWNRYMVKDLENDH